MMKKTNEFEGSVSFTEYDYFMAPIISFNVKKDYVFSRMQLLSPVRVRGKRLFRQEVSTVVL